MLQGKVFGAGYPSAPTVTLEEFFDQQYKKMMEEQRSSQTQTASAKSKPSEDDIEKDLNIEDSDSEEALRKDREWDKFKDDHKRGSGNRQNMG
jgi:immunoglobulin-binding protein 1